MSRSNNDTPSSKTPNLSTEKQLQQALERLELSTRKVIDTRGYSKDAKSLRALQEMIKEQLIHANFSNSTRTIR